MPRGNWRKRWIKLYVTGWLHGTIRWQLSSEERGVWADFLALAGEKQKDGAICDNDGRPLPRDFIANQLNIKLSLLNSFIAKAISENMMEEKEGVLFVSNYQSYQSEYERQKPFREKAKELSALAKRLGFTSVEEWDANEDRLKREGKWESEEDYLAEDVRVINFEGMEDGTDYTGTMFWADNAWFEKEALAGNMEPITNLPKALKARYDGKYSKKDVDLFVAKFLKERDRLMNV